MSDFNTFVAKNAGESLQMMFGDTSKGGGVPVATLRFPDKKVVEVTRAMVFAPEVIPEVNEQGETYEVTTTIIHIDEAFLHQKGIRDFVFDAKVDLRDWGPGWNTDLQTCKWISPIVIWGLRRKPRTRRDEMYANV